MTRHLQTSVVEVSTPAGAGRWHVSWALGRARGQVLLGHGAGAGVDTVDLVLLATELPRFGVDVARFEQPWRLAGRRVAGPPATLDRAWTHAVPVIRRAELPLIVGGRSAGARVACRTATTLGAAGVLAIAFPFRPPGTARSRHEELPELPVLIVQGDRDRFGTPDQVRPQLSRCHELLEVPGADHSLRVGRAGPLTPSEVGELVVLGVRRWLTALTRG